MAAYGPKRNLSCMVIRGASESGAQQRARELSYIGQSATSMSSDRLRGRDALGRDANAFDVDANSCSLALTASAAATKPTFATHDEGFHTVLPAEKLRQRW